MKAHVHARLKNRRFILAASATCALCVTLVAPSAQAQAIRYSTALNTIGPATITQSNLEQRPQSAIQSIGPASVENRAMIVPAVFDSSTGRFLSALGNSRGAIAVGPTNVVSVSVTTLQSTFVISAGSGSSVQRTDTLSSPAAAVALPQITTLQTTNQR